MFNFVHSKNTASPKFKMGSHNPTTTHFGIIYHPVSSTCHCQSSTVQFHLILLLSFLDCIGVLHTQMQPTGYNRCSMVCQYITIVSPAKAAEPIEKPFGLWIRMGPRNHVLDGGPDPLMRKGNFEGEKGRPIVKYRRTFCCELCKNG